MKIEQTPLETCEVQMTVEVDAEQVDKAKRAAAKRLAQKYNIPGFRKGKAPYEIIKRQFGEGAVWEEALDELGQRVYQAALEETKLDPIAPGALTDVKLEPVVFTFNVPLKPEIDLGAYRSTRFGYTPAMVNEDAINEALESMRETQAVLEPVERPSQLGDVVKLDIKAAAMLPATAKDEPDVPTEEAAKPEEAGEAADPASTESVVEPSGPVEEFLMDDKDVEVLLDSKVDWPMPGFNEKVLGMNVGDERHFELVFPDDYANEQLRGQTAKFDVKCNDVKLRTLPEWDDELAKSLGDYESLADMRTEVGDDLLRRAKRRVDDEYSRAVMDTIVAGAMIKYPPVLLKEEVDGLVEDLDRRLREQRLTLEDYMKIQDLTTEKLREDLQPTANERLRRALVLSKVIELEKVEVSHEEIDERIALMVTPFGPDAEKYLKILNTENGHRSVRLDLLSERAAQRLVAIAKGEAPEIPEATAEAEAVAEPEVLVTDPLITEAIEPQAETPEATPAE
ncbi:MAG: trigger factor [Chloroflexi bacterium]|nr:trigger factor [Chloroflexota bacterium]